MNKLGEPLFDMLSYLYSSKPHAAWHRTDSMDPSIESVICGDGDVYEHMGRVYQDMKISGRGMPQWH